MFFLKMKPFFRGYEVTGLRRLQGYEIAKSSIYLATTDHHHVIGGQVTQVRGEPPTVAVVAVEPTPVTTNLASSNKRLLQAETKAQFWNRRKKILCTADHVPYFANASNLQKF